MKKLLVLLFACLALRSLSQINVGSRIYLTSTEVAGKLDEDDINDLKYKPTVLVIPDSQKDKLELYKEATSGWTFNFIRVITTSELPSFAEKMTSHAFMYIGWSRVDRSSYFHLDYIMPYNSNGKVKEKFFATVELNPDNETSSKAWDIKPDDSEKYFGKLINEVANFHNFTPAHLKLYLSFISAQLSAHSTHWRNVENEITPNKELVKQLINDTLFIADYVMPFNKKVSESDVLKQRKELMQEYSHQARFIGTDEFEQRVMNATKPTFVLICQNIGNVPKLNIFEAKTGTLVYSSAHVNWGFTSGVTEKHIKEMTKKIEKTAKK